MMNPTAEAEPEVRIKDIVCRECGTRIYPRRSPAGPMALFCECVLAQAERALAGLDGVRVEFLQ